MGLVPKNLSSTDQTTLKKLETEIIRTLRKASTNIKAGGCKALSQTWFGDNTRTWMTSLGRDLNTLASMLNVKTITVDGLNYRQRDPEFYGWAHPPTGGWQKHTSMTDAQGQNFRISLDSAWDALPDYRRGTAPGFSKFHGIVHELTHLILSTDDIKPNPYGPTNCTTKANTNPQTAKDNADNWAFFVDDIRPLAAVVRASSASGALPPYTDWMTKTKLGSFSPRNRQLGRVDDALKAIGRGYNRTRLTTLKQAFDTWYNANRNDRRRRNKNGIVENLRLYLNERG